MRALSEAEKKELTVARFAALSRLTSTYGIVFIIALVGNIIVYHDHIDWRISVAPQVAFIALTLVRMAFWEWTRRNPDFLAKYSSMIVKQEIVIWAGGSALISLMDMYFFFNSTGFDKFYTIIAQICVGVLAFVTLSYVRTVAVTLVTFLFVPLSALLFWHGETAYVVTGTVVLAVYAGLVISANYYSNDLKSLLISKFDIQKLGEQNARLASIDMLTELPNRRYYFDQLEKAFEEAQASGETIAAGVVDLDGFKPVNDTYGHRVGDQVLGIAAKRLASVQSDMIEICRIGGDEFAFFIRNVESNELLEGIGNAFIASLKEPITVGDLTVGIGCSVGFATCESSDLRAGNVENAGVIYENADFALYHAKKTGKGRTVIFSQEHKDILLENGRIQQALRTADIENELFCVFQPMVDIRSGRVKTFEALARWNSQTLGKISPSQFIPAIEQMGYMSVVTPALLKKCMIAMQDWPEEINLSFNLSSHDVCSPDTVQKLLQVVSESGIDPERIYFEVTESVVIQDFDLALAHLNMIKLCGIKIALDDFGTGYSSLSYVNQLPLDKLKIDRCFVTDIESNHSSLNIVRSVISLCQDMRMECVVEGAETKGQVEALASVGCETIQGYFYSRPLPADDIAPFLLLNLRPKDEQSIPMAQAS